MRIPRIDKTTPYSSAFCIRFQFFTVLSLTSATIKYQFFICEIIWYQMFHICKDLVPVLHTCKFWYQFSHVMIWYKYSSQPIKTDLVLHTLKTIKMLNLSTHFTPQKYRNWPYMYVNFTFAKSDLLVPILHMVWCIRTTFYVCFKMLQICKNYNEFDLSEHMRF